MNVTDTKREQREWWAYFEDAVIRVTGFACSPDLPGAWWCPQIGHTLNEGFQLFNREDEALRLAIRDVDRVILLANGRRARWQERLDKTG